MSVSGLVGGLRTVRILSLGPPPPTPEASLTSLLQTAIDILTTVVRNTKPPLSQLLICQAFPAVAQCTLHTDDNATMQVSPRRYHHAGV